jgi:predicted TIM-barrel fold metal-dependent hydrolase
MNMVRKPAVYNDVKVVDADTHIADKYDHWTSRATAKYKDRVPKVVNVDGENIWVIDGDKKMGPAFPVTAVRKDGSKCHGKDIMLYGMDNAFDGAYDPKARTAYMDKAGIAAQIAYPNLLGFGNQKSMHVDKELRSITTLIYNDAMAEFQAESGNRIFPQILIPWWDLELSLKEVERCHKMGMRGVNTNPDPNKHGMPTLPEAHWTPLWEMCQDLDLPINFHIGGGFESSAWFGEGGWSDKDPNVWMTFGSSMMFFHNYRTFANIFLTRWLERFPKLKIVSVESGVGWIPFMIETLEYFMEEEGIKHDVPIREIFARQMYACAWFERRNIVHTARDVGVDNIMFQTDFPHPVCLYPDALEYVEPAAAAFTPEERKKVYGGNAGKVYNIDLSKIAV